MSDPTITDKAVTAAAPTGAASAAFVEDALGRAQANWARVTDPDVPNHDGRMSTAWFIHHTTIVILLENLRRLDPELADRLVPWALGTDSIFSDSYAGELVYEWRQQLTAGEPLSPIAPEDSDPAALPHLADRTDTTGLASDWVRNETWMPVEHPAEAALVARQSADRDTETALAVAELNKLASAFAEGRDALKALGLAGESAVLGGCAKSARDRAASLRGEE